MCLNCHFFVIVNNVVQLCLHRHWVATSRGWRSTPSTRQWSSAISLSKISGYFSINWEQGTKYISKNVTSSVFNQDCQDLHLAQRSCHHCDPLHRCLCRAHHLHKVQKSCQVGIFYGWNVPDAKFLPSLNRLQRTGIFTVTQSHPALCQLKTSFSLFSSSTSLATFLVLWAIFVFFSWKKRSLWFLKTFTL